MAVKAETLRFPFYICSVQESFDMCRAVVCLGIAIGRLNYTKEISSLIPFLCGVLLQKKDGCLISIVWE